MPYLHYITMLRRYKLLIPSLILLCSALRVFIPSDNHYAISPQHYAGLLAAITCITVFFVFRKAYKYALNLTLTLGLVNILIFTPSSVTFSIYLSKINIGFQPFSLVLILLTILLILPQRSKMSPVVSEEATAMKQNHLKEDREKFERLFSNKSPEELNQIITDDRYGTAAKEAAKHILNDRTIQND